MGRSPTPHATSSRGWVSIGALGALSFASGLFLGRWSGESAPSKRTDGLDPNSASIEHSLQELRGEVERLRLSISMSLREPTSTRASSPDREPASGESAIDAAVERLEQALRGLDRSRMQADGRWRSSGPGRPSLADLEAEFDRRGSTEAERDSLAKDLTRAHLLWTVDDLVERYGVPSRVDGFGTANLSIVYAFDGGTQDGPRPCALFIVSQGYVIHAAIETD